MKGWLAFAAACALALVFLGGAWYEAGVKDIECQGAADKDRADKEEAARAKEHMWQGVINDTVKNYQVREAGLRLRLDAALDKLRQRPARPAADAADPSPPCTGATGVELYREDGEFLEREAARAESIRGGLADCYRVIDALR